MRATFTIAERELRSYFTSPIGFVVLGGFLLISAYFFVIPLIGPSHYGSIEVLLPNLTIWLIFLIPALTMRLVAEEKRSGSIELLATAPVTDWQVILGKYLGVLGFYAVMVAATLQYVFGIAMVAKADEKYLVWPGGIGIVLLAATLVAAVVAAATPGRRVAGWVALGLAALTLIVLFFTRSVLPETGPIVTGYIGLLLLGAAFLGIGLLTSTVTRNQIVAYVVGVVILLGMFLLQWVAGLPGVQETWVGETLGYLSVSEHLQHLSRGILDSRDIILYLTWVAVTLFLSVRALSTGKWK